MIKLRDVSLRRGTKHLFAAVTLELASGLRVGVVGQNGCGKSSLLQALTGELAPERGEIYVPRDYAIAVVRQDFPSGSETVMEFIRSGDRELLEVESALEQSSDGSTIAVLHARLADIGGYSADARAAKLAAGLGFGPGNLSRPIREFSGGWQRRLCLAQALMCRSDLLLLDEPTNHLDFETVVWLESWLGRYPGTLIVISHDREFLDNVVGQVIHIEGGRVRAYRGNYSDFERLRAERLTHQSALHRRQQQEIAHITRFVSRFRAKATKARQAQSRLKALERMQRIAPVPLAEELRFEFLAPEKLPNPLLSLHAVSAGYGGNPVIRDVHLTLLPSARIGVLGRNGAGKSTLMSVLAGLKESRDGQRTKHPGCRIGYFDQHGIDRLEPQASPLVHLQRLLPDQRQQSLRDHLSKFGFRGETVNAPVSRFSNGEKAKLLFCLLVLDRPNLLLLDEPTNHLDLDMRLGLELALQDFPGAVVAVSHDRHLMRTVCDELLLVGEGTLRAFEGDIDDYARGLESAGAMAEAPSAEPKRRHAAGPPSPTGMARSNKAARARAARERARRRPFVARLERVEKILGELNEKRACLDDLLADPRTYNQPGAPPGGSALEDTIFDRARTAQRIEQLESEWLELQEMLDTMVEER